jgi:cation diffusion facilitator family transporter
VTAEDASRRIAVTSVLIGAALAAAKITIGLRAHSTATVSDGVESASDVLTSLLVLLGLVIAAKPPDAQHPYGHGRLETISGLVVGMVLTASGVLLAFESLHLADGAGSPSAFAIWPLLASIGTKCVMSVSKLRYGRKIGSSALMADGWHDTVDIFSGSVALLGLGIALVNPGLTFADRIAGSAVGVIIVLLGIRVVRDTMLQLMDTMPDAQAMDRIRMTGLLVPGVLGIEKCYARKTGLKWHVDLHLEVDPAMSVYDSHEIATQVKEKIRSDLDWVADVLVHVEPHMLATISNGPQGAGPHWPHGKS